MTTDIRSSPVINKKGIIALDCDGVLLDYSRTFAQIYEKAFGKQLTIVSPKSYHVTL
jgi:beta-phosphoglucomutase-like phosphatase (HAD superfamily)